MKIRPLHDRVLVRRIEADYQRSADTHLVPLTVDEFGLAAVCYPIIFDTQSKTPLAVTALVTATFNRSTAPLRKNTEQGEVGDTALFLVSSLGRGVTGEVIHVDGGMHVMALGEL